MDFSNIPYGQLLNTFRPVAVFLVLYCFLFATVGRIFGNERRARLLVSVIIAVYATNSILVNGWDTLIATSISATLGTIAKHILSRLGRIGQSGK